MNSPYPEPTQRTPDATDRVISVQHLIVTRPDLVERQCREALSDEPHNVVALETLSMSVNNQNRCDEALEVVGEAIKQAPDRYIGYSYRAFFLRNLGRLSDANAAIQEALRLAPEREYNYLILAMIVRSEENWQKVAVATADGLRLDPEHEDLSALRVLALRRLGDREQAVAAAREALVHHPNSAAIHAELGETLLKMGRSDEAQEHFRQALQIDPNSEQARSGVVTALKARHWIYRNSYKYFQIPSDIRKFSSLGLILVARFASELGQTDRRRASGAAVFLAVVVLGIAITWLAEPVFNSLLRMNRTGRWALNDRERRESNVVAFCFGVGTLSLICWPVFFGWVAAVLGLGAIVLAAPLTAYWRNARTAEEKQTATVLSVMVVGTLAVGLIGFVLTPTATLDFHTWPPATLISAVLFGFLTASSVLASDPSTFRR